MARTAKFVPLLLALLLCACGEDVGKPVKRVPSSDGRYWALIRLDRGNAMSHDWYAVEIVEAHPRWYEFLPRLRGAGLCTLQGPGTLGIDWAGPRQLVVTCMDCDRKKFFVFGPGMQKARTKYGIIVRYRFRPGYGSKKHWPTEEPPSASRIR